MTRRAYTCQHCGATLAQIEPGRLWLSATAYSTEGTALHCATCGRRRYWKPERCQEPRTPVGTALHPLTTVKG